MHTLVLEMAFRPTGCHVRQTSHVPPLNHIPHVVNVGPVVITMPSMDRFQKLIPTDGSLAVEPPTVGTTTGRTVSPKTTKKAPTKPKPDTSAIATKSKPSKEAGASTKVKSKPNMADAPMVTHGSFQVPTHTNSSTGAPTHHRSASYDVTLAIAPAVRNVRTGEPADASLYAKVCLSRTL